MREIDLPKNRVEMILRLPEMEQPKISQVFCGREFVAELTQIHKPIEFDFRLKSNGGYVALHSLVRADGETVIDGAVSATRKDLRGRMTFVPPGASVTGWSKINGNSTSVLAVHLEPHIDPEMPDLSKIPPQLYFENDYVKYTLIKIRTLMDRNGPDDRLYAETLGVLLRLELARRLNPEVLREPLRGGLSSRQIQKLTAFIDSNFTTDIRLQDMANLLDISRSHLLSAFKHSMGMSPYQFVLQMRVERAKVLMGNSSMSIADIAQALGFRTALQLSRAFRRFAGKPPRDYRRDRD